MPELLLKEIDSIEYSTTNFGELAIKEEAKKAFNRGEATNHGNPYYDCQRWTWPLASKGGQLAQSWLDLLWTLDLACKNEGCQRPAMTRMKRMKRRRNKRVKVKSESMEVLDESCGAPLHLHNHQSPACSAPPWHCCLLCTSSAAEEHHKQ